MYDNISNPLHVDKIEMFEFSVNFPIIIQTFVHKRYYSYPAWSTLAYASVTVHKWTVPNPQFLTYVDSTCVFTCVLVLNVCTNELPLVTHTVVWENFDIKKCSLLVRHNEN